MSDTPSHPAPFSAPIMDVLGTLITGWPGPVLDPYAGIGRVHELGRTDTIGVEIEEEWAEGHERTFWGDSASLKWNTENVVVMMPGGAVAYPIILGRKVGSVVTSPDYGNRMSDQYLGTPVEQALRHEEGIMPRRRGYAISLGRKVSAGATTRYKFGPLYRQMHTQIWTAVTSVCQSDAKLALNVSDFYETRDGEDGPSRVHVVAFWVEMIASLGWVVEKLIPVGTRRFRDGANSDLRVDDETIVVAHLAKEQA